LHPKQSLYKPENRVASTDTHYGHIEHIGTQRHQPAISKHETLNDKNTGHHQDGGAGAKQDGSQHAANQVTRGTASDRKIEHLCGKHESGGQSEHRHLPGFQIGTDLAQSDPNTDSRRPGGEKSGFSVQETVR
jgi:hypothetical protein